MRNETLPILLKEQKILLIGGGDVALQKAKVLNANNISFEIISENVNKKIYKLCDDIKVKKFKIKDIKENFIIIDATGSKKVSDKLLKYKKSNNILINVVDKPNLCDFYFMSLTTNQALQIAVTSNGVSPTAAKHFRDKCQNLIPDNLDTYMNYIKLQRDNGIIEPDNVKSKIENMTKSKAYLVGCGLGDPEFLTIRAYNIIKSVDVVLYDHLISKEIMDIVPDTTKKVFVGKQQGFHTRPQEEINELIAKYSNQGFSVARLKSGDPFVFGRGAEELIFLNSQNIDTEVIPGISSAISAPLMANIPITSRGYANSFTVVSAHLKGHRVNLEWIDLLHKKEHTVVVLMGLSRVSKIVNRAIERNVNPDLSCAIISNASRSNQQIITTTLKDLITSSKDALSPAILVFGDVISYTQNLVKVKQ